VTGGLTELTFRSVLVRTLIMHLIFPTLATARPAVPAGFSFPQDDAITKNPAQPPHNRTGCERHRRGFYPLPLLLCL
jgi:hypothetical protein